MPRRENPEIDVTDAVKGLSIDPQLESLVSRLWRVEEERREAAAAVRDLYTEAKSAGYNVKALRLVVKRQLESAGARFNREQAEAEAQLLESRIGTLATMPLGKAAIAKARAGAEAH